MKIYRLKLNADNFQHFLPDEEGIWKTNRLSFDCTKKAAEWVPPKVYIYNPTLEKGNFFALGVNGGTVILDKHAKEQLGVLLQMAGELLPIYYEDEEYAVLNVTECINALDAERTEWVRGTTSNTKLYIEAYAFKKNRLPESTIFKIPETRRSEILVCERSKEPECEFKARIKEVGLTGAFFEELWDEDRETLIKRQRLKLRISEPERG